MRVPEGVCGELLHVAASTLSFRELDVRVGRSSHSANCHCGDRHSPLLFCNRPEQTGKSRNVQSLNTGNDRSWSELPQDEREDGAIRLETEIINKAILHKQQFQQ